MSKSDPYIAKTHIRHNGTLYSPGDEISRKDMKKEVAEYHAANGRLEIPGADDSSEEESTKEGPYTKSDLQDENKSFTIDLVKEAGYPEEEWGDLNKEPLIDYYLEEQAEE